MNMDIRTTGANTKEEARQEAIQWQAEFADKSLSLGELAEWQAYFTELGNRFGLLDEFHENGIC